ARSVMARRSSRAMRAGKWRAGGLWAQRVPACSEETDMERRLWRVERDSLAPPALAPFDVGLRLHLEHTDLLTILVRIGDQEQAYLSAVGCDGCWQGRHRSGCSSELLRRLLVATCAQTDLALVPHGLARRPYTRVLLVLPRRQSAPLDDLDLGRWEQARLIVHWKHGTRGLTTAALLAVGAGPEPIPVVRERGWRVRRLPTVLGLRLANAPIPASVVCRRAWLGPPFLLTSTPRVPHGTRCTAQATDRLDPEGTHDAHG